MRYILLTYFGAKKHALCLCIPLEPDDLCQKYRVLFTWLNGRTSTRRVLECSVVGHQLGFRQANQSKHIGGLAKPQLIFVACYLTFAHNSRHPWVNPFSMVALTVPASDGLMGVIAPVVERASKKTALLCYLWR